MCVDNDEGGVGEMACMVGELSWNPLSHFFISCDGNNIPSILQCE
jgi:hypothetical protein